MTSRYTAILLFSALMASPSFAEEVYNPGNPASYFSEDPQMITDESETESEANAEDHNQMPMIADNSSISGTNAGGEHQTTIIDENGQLKVVDKHPPSADAQMPESQLPGAANNPPPNAPTSPGMLPSAPTGKPNFPQAQPGLEGSQHSSNLPQPTPGQPPAPMPQQPAPGMMPPSGPGMPMQPQPGPGMTPPPVGGTPSQPMPPPSSMQQPESMPGIMPQTIQQPMPGPTPQQPNPTGGGQYPNNVQQPAPQTPMMPGVPPTSPQGGEMPQPGSLPNNAPPMPNNSMSPGMSQNTINGSY